MNHRWSFIRGKCITSKQKIHSRIPPCDVKQKYFMTARSSQEAGVCPRVVYCIYLLVANIKYDKMSEVVWNLRGS